MPTHPLSPLLPPRQISHNPACFHIHNIFREKFGATVRIILPFPGLLVSTSQKTHKKILAQQFSSLRVRIGISLPTIALIHGTPPFWAPCRTLPPSNSPMCTRKAKATCNFPCPLSLQRPLSSFVGHTRARTHTRIHKSTHKHPGYSGPFGFEEGGRILHFGTHPAVKKKCSGHVCIAHGQTIRQYAQFSLGKNMRRVPQYRRGVRYDRTIRPETPVPHTARQEIDVKQEMRTRRYRTSTAEIPQKTKRSTQSVLSKILLLINR